MDNEKIGKFILKLRQDKNLTQKELADKIGVTDKAISKWECGKGLPDVTLLQPLATALGTSVIELLDGEVIANSDKEQTDKAIVQALEHYKWEQRRTAGILLIILGICLLLVFLLSIAGKWYFHAFVLGVVSLVIGIILVVIKNPLVYRKIPKPVAQWVAFGTFIAAIVLEALPYGAVLVFAPSPEERLTRVYSYFDLIPFGNANFAPLITAILTVTLAVLTLISIFVKRNASGLRKALFIISLVASIISICPMLYGYKYVTLIGGFITLLLATSTVFCAIANVKQIP